MDREGGNKEKIRKCREWIFLHFLSISSFSLHFLFIFSFSLHFLTARLAGWQNLCSPDFNIDNTIIYTCTLTFSQSGGGCPLPPIFVNDSIVKRGIPSLTIWAMSHHMCNMSQRKSTSQEVYFHAVPPRPHQMWYKFRSDTITSDSLREKEGKSVL